MLKQAGLKPHLPGGPDTRSDTGTWHALASVYFSTQSAMGSDVSLPQVVPRRDELLPFVFVATQLACVQVKDALTAEFRHYLQVAADSVQLVGFRRVKVPVRIQHLAGLAGQVQLAGLGFVADSSFA
jgi:hypothetical protein